HVFNPDSVQISAEQVRTRWEDIKKSEKARKGLFDDFEHYLPALYASYKIGKKSGTVGFDWPEPEFVFSKVEEEVGEVLEAMQSGDKVHLQEELGDLLFVVSNLVRKCGFEPEETLRLANQKFINRYQTMERLAEARGVAFEALALDDKEAYWDEAKRLLKKQKGT
ncbi:MAG: nucleoside triphosphate pyrophosphohydrolase, partial [Acidobacteria bacterium]|nr:nucleoside triphosphate pyrophosphohydrolase [Acidobacteriota bacterium]